MPGPEDREIVQQTVSMPSWLRKKLSDAAHLNVRTLSGEAVVRLSMSFGVLPNGESADNGEGSAS